MLSDHFSLAEMTRSQWANQHHEPNTPGPREAHNLGILCQEILEPARLMYGHPLIINSGYRSVKVNRGVGGKPGSYHVHGKAADIACSSNDEARILARILNMQPLTDLTLVEHKGGAIWIHVQWSIKPRHEINLDYKG